MGMAAITSFPMMGTKMHIGRENSGKFWKGIFFRIYPWVENTSALYILQYAYVQNQNTHLLNIKLGLKVFYS